MDKSRFAKVCGLLTSNFDGERSAAAERATQMLRAAGLTWSDVVDRAFGGTGPSTHRSEEPEQRQRETAPRSPRGAHERFMVFEDYGIRYVLMRLCNLESKGGGFTEWESHFLDSLVAQGVNNRGATEKQWHSIVSMYKKYFPGE